MGILINILVILVAVIAFLFLYYLSLKKDKESQDYKLPFTRPAIDFEFGKNIGVDVQEMEIDKGISSFKETEIKRKEENNNIQEENIFINKSDYNFIRLFSRDPDYLYAYWEINDSTFYQNIPCLKIYNKTEKKDYEIEIKHNSKNWYLKGKPNNSYQISIGYKKNGMFYFIALSNLVYTPADRPSKIIDEHWMTIEELSKYSFRIEMDTMSMIKEIEGRKIQEELNADSFVLSKKE